MPPKRSIRRAIDEDGHSLASCRFDEDADVIGGVRGGERSQIVSPGLLHCSKAFGPLARGDDEALRAGIRLLRWATEAARIAGTAMIRHIDFEGIVRFGEELGALFIE